MTLEQLKSLIEKATPGPWTLYERNNNGHVYTDHHSVVGLAVHDHPEYSSISNPIEISANGEFIATSRTALPAALELIEQMAEALGIALRALDAETRHGRTLSGHNAIAEYEAFKKNVGGE